MTRVRAALVDALLVLLALPFLIVFGGPGVGGRHEAGPPPPPPEDKG